jgi:hypothetical protein
LKRKRRRSKLLDRSRAVECADKAMSNYIRERDGWKCVTCGKKAHGQGMHNGHFIPRGYSIWRYDECNCHAQCYRCNEMLSGNWPAYYDFMVRTYGQDHVHEMMESKYAPVKRTVADLLEIEQHYKDKLEVLNGRRNVRV